MPIDHHAGPGDRVAIVGIGGIFAGASSPGELWTQVVSAADATRDVPPGRWLVEPARALDPRPGQPDRVVTTRGGYVDPVRFDPSGTALEPALVDRLDPVFHLALAAARQAWEDSGPRAGAGERGGVIIGNIVLPTETASALSVEFLGRAFAERAGLASGGAPAPFEPLNAFPAGLPAAMIARALGLRGAACTLDAACGSSLYALKLAVDELRSGRADVMITGGVSRPDALYTQMGFSQLRALSPRGRSAPLDQDADGLIVGEGAGMFVLKRLDDAIAQGNRIYGIIAGIGLSNDRHGDLMAPDCEGQLRAIRSAYEQAGWSPADADLIECHATGTPRGDSVEVESLRALWSGGSWRPGQCVIGSIKGSVGHALTAAGSAGLLKVLLAIQHQTLPPTAHFERAAHGLDREHGPFVVLTEGRPWPRRGPAEPRRAAISGFGFGGINAHVLVEEWLPANAARREPRPRHPETDAQMPIAIVGIAAQVGTAAGSDALARLVFGEEDSGSGRRIRSLELPRGAFRIPPLELAEMLPQQSLLLRVASEAIEQAGWSAERALRTGVLVGIGLDLNTTNYHLRWSMAERAAHWNRELGLGLGDDELAAWAEDLRQAAGPPLSANRTMGSLGGVVASRVARAFRIGGPSFTVSCDETSGVQASAFAIDWLRRGEIDAAIVGAVDFASDERVERARRRLGEGAGGGTDAAVCLVLERLDDARRRGRPIVAVIRDVATGSREREATPSDAGAASGLLEVAAAALRLHERVFLPGLRPWVVNRADGPRRLTVESVGIGGQSSRVELEEAPVIGGAEAGAAASLATPARLRRSGLFAVEGADTASLVERLSSLAELCREAGGRSIDELAADWSRRHPLDARWPSAVAIVADSTEGLGELVRRARQALFDARRTDIRLACGSIHWHDPAVPRGVAFVYPGLGNYFEGMGRELGLLWPEVLRRQERETRTLRDQLAPELWWNGGLPGSFGDLRAPILAQVAVGSLATDVLARLGIVPDAAIGYSMGESAALVSLRAWCDRDLLASRLVASPLFSSELAGPCDAARRAWGLDRSQPVDWMAGIVSRPADDVRAAIAAAGIRRAYVLIRNAADETVIGGERSSVIALAAALGCSPLELPAVGTVHCEIGREVERDYRALHDVETSAPPGIAFYSGVTGRRYAVDRRSAADAITAQASRAIDFAATIENAHADGVGLFIEVGPGSSCTRLIGRILADRPHAAVSACRPDRDAFPAVLEVLACAIAHRRPVNLESIPGAVRGSSELGAASRPTIRVEVGPPEFRVPPCPARAAPEGNVPVPTMNHHAADPDPLPASNGFASRGVLERPAPALPDLAGPLHDAELARLEAHRAFLRVAQGTADLMARQIGYQLELIEAAASGAADLALAAPPHEPPGEPVLFDRAQCLALAIGSAASVFGPEFAEVDTFPTRVRLPDEPLMFVDRIVLIEGTPRALDRGRIVTEHVVRPGAWYLEDDRVAACVAMEAGQADLVLSGFLGVDFLTRGRSVYRLLDATVTFHRELPRKGDVLRYDIRITQFFRQGTTILFRFEYDATVGGEPLITMRDGCAGFFTAEELAAGKGITPAALRSPTRELAPAIRPDELVAARPGRLDDAAVDALRRGDLASAFGAPFDEVSPGPRPALPGGLMAMIRRVELVEPAGGPAGLGLIRAEADVHPDDWYMVCHFIDDHVMPGTLMYECCLHALRILLLRQGWVAPRAEAAFEPVPGVANRLRCRGQITGATRRVIYEVAIKERGYRPEPYAIADALIIADGRPIVSVTDLALRLSGTDRAELGRLWAGRARGEGSLMDSIGHMTGS